MTVQEALFAPSAVVTVMIALPLATAVTNPLADTLAMLGSLLTKKIFLLVAFSGDMVAFS